MAPAKKNEGEISILELNQGELEVCILGTSPFIFNAMSEKAWQDLLFPRPRKNAAERASSMKHNPMQEFRNSVYHHTDKNKPTYLSFLSVAFKKAMAGAALDIPGAAKAQIGRLVWAVGERVDMYGVPQISCMIVRSADMNKTPDVRTRAILPEWACRITLRYMSPILKEKQIVNLLATGGVTQGVGDYRQQKGGGSYGQFRLVANDDPDFVRICKEGTRSAQLKAMESPTYYDEETSRILPWFDEEVIRRGNTKQSVTAIPIDDLEGEDIDDNVEADQLS